MNKDALIVFISGIIAEANERAEKTDPTDHVSRNYLAGRNLCAKEILSFLMSLDNEGDQEQ